MKKLIISLSFALTSLCYSQKPLMTKPLGIDPITGLNQQIAIWNFAVNAHASLITIDYTVQTLSPKGLVVSEQGGNYIRFNRDAEYYKDKKGNDSIIKTPANMQWDKILAGDSGKKMNELIKQTLLPINSLTDIDKLKQ